MSDIARQGCCPPAIIRAWKNGDFTDLSITCGSSTFNVHKVVICSTSDFFGKSIKFAVGKEAQENCIDLPEDDAEMIQRLIDFAYLGDYTPGDGRDIAKFSGHQHESSTAAPTTHHPRKIISSGALFSSSPMQCACLSPNINDIYQPINANAGQKTHMVMAKKDDTIQVENPLTIHAKMYSLGDKYQVEGLSALAKTKFESCLAEHAHSEDFIEAVQIAYSTTPDSNRGLRDAVINAFRKEFQTDIKQIPGAEAKLDCIDELSFLLIKSWPVKIESTKPAAQAKPIKVNLPAAASSASPVNRPPGPPTAARASQPVATPATSSLFGRSPAGGLFGNTRPVSTQPAQPSPPLFLLPVRPAQPSSSLFGSTPSLPVRPAQTSSSSVGNFGAPLAQASPPLFR